METLSDNMAIQDALRGLFEQYFDSKSNVNTAITLFNNYSRGMEKLIEKSKEDKVLKKTDPISFNIVFELE